MQVELVKGRSLSSDDLAAWSTIQRSNHHLDSPFFRPELMKSVASVRDDVEVAVVRDAGEAVGFLPFQRGGDNRAQALLGRLSEFHGLISPADTGFDPEEALRGCGLTSWSFDHVPDSQSSFAPFAWGAGESPYLDLSNGYDAYLADRRANGSSLVSQVQRKARKLAREVGPLRFEFHTTCNDAWNALLQWKAQQHQRTGVLQVLRYEWVLQVLEQLRVTKSDDFAAPLSALYAGDRLVAVHLGLQSRRALHLWFTAYDPALGKYSPGLVMLLEMARTAAQEGLMRFDLGRGNESYKQRFKSGSIDLLEGAVDFRPTVVYLRRTWHHAKQQLRESRWRHLEAPLKATRRMRQWLAFR